MRRALVFTRNWYARFERPISSASLIGGFVFDAVALKRVDLFWENIWVVVHILAVAFFIVLINLQEDEKIDSKDPARLHFWYINALQFVFGGILSTFLVFYFRSTTFAVTWPFLLLLAIAFVANESLKKHYAVLTFQISLFYLSLLAFAIFIVPVLFHRIGTDVFLISGFASLAVLGLFLLGLGFFARDKFRRSRRMLRFSILGIFLTTNILYFFNLIPPIPISLKDGGIYHSVIRTESGNYVVQKEDVGWLGYFVLAEDVHIQAGAPVYAYSAIFSPTFFNTNIVHEWQWYNSDLGGWITMSRIGMPTAGGRDEGYRAYSVKNNMNSGKWRVDIKTVEGQIIGRLRFNVVEVATQSILKTEIK